VHLFNNKLLIVAGVRFERTKDDGAGQLDDPTAQYQKDAAGKILLDASGAPILITTDALGRARLRYKERGTRSIRTYDGFYPSLNLTYNITDKILIRGAVTETIARPDLGNIIPGTAIADPTASNLTITVNNTGLKPWTARGYDLSLETYNLKGGYGSIGVFQRDITDFFNAISTQATPELLSQYGLPNDPTYLAYQITTLTNGGNAKITGFEFAYNQDLLFLPHWARGFQVFVNATKLRLQGGNQADFSAFAPSNYAAGIRFIRSRFSIRLSSTYQGETRQALVAASAANGIPQGVYNYQGERFRLGVDAQYGFSRHFAVYGSMTDLIGPGLDITSRQYGANAPDYEKDRRHQQLGSIITLGVKGEF
jgi:TonB-dependent receptor